ncbi:LLM class flavin-dependent oxidoreductase [Geodermatophilus sabuli]|uniref:5,10-methylenetetrahydromethanopterin reductase n=1 Tax=Geodermatophilus sabuli TaxID=1564158 RepID=A0A285ECT5_9ACTN|nr:LLM class flavin-dependent oxidoreductase [Geodermatophilus sabuli]MBB3085554.1 5,10-methylenetetrahydromethanopterin reductase [Geodermatophilus sabuli]SNX96024.1 5,10-methylenetetrahydromethanopterin reductase [Geodermatophilus sabuli]
MGNRTEFWTSLTPNDPREAPAEAARLEAEGWDGALMVDSQCMFPEVWAYLTLAAQGTSRIKLATGVTNPITRHPSVTAAAAASLQVVSDGRAVLGIGRGDSALAYVGASPMAIGAFEHYLEVLQTYLRGEEVDLADAGAMVVNAKVGFDNLAIGSGPKGSSLKWLKDYGMPKVPIESYATGPKAIASSARVAETVILGLAAEINRVAWGVEIARTAAAGVGQDVGVGCAVVVMPHEDVRLARDLARPTVASMARFSAMNNKVIGPATPAQAETLLKLAEVYDMNRHGATAVQTEVLPDEFVDQFGIVGSVDTCVDRIREFVDLGLQRMTFWTPYVKTPDLAHSYDLLVNEVLPKVRAG